MAGEVKTVRAAALSVSIFMITGAAGATPIFLGPTPYLRFADNPLSGIAFAYFHLDTFETGALSVPGVSLTSGAFVLPPSPQTDSVDADDGAIDGSGAGGRSLYSGNLGLVRFNFAASALGGQLPTHAGVVWTDVGNTSAVLGFAPVTFEAFDAAGVSLGFIGPTTLGDGSASGATAEDRFFGVINTGGLSAIELRLTGSTDWEADHLMFGAASTSVPEPGSFLLAITGLAMLPFIRRRRLGPVPFK